jgi:hypothetical protein
LLHKLRTAANRISSLNVPEVQGKTIPDLGKTGHFLFENRAAAGTFHVAKSVVNSPKNAERARDARRYVWVSDCARAE